ncbi:acyltransferase family protein [Alteraurantiacibacter palmitatis]|uniref:Acyltransferase family protein n=1 Tax=Alteraurantiacibacter palmitatis TaxID=2054628 RepID=A0ABV7E4I5_9SPHN
MDQHQGRVVSVQLLRFLAAAVVAGGHLAFAFSDHVAGGLGLDRSVARASNHASQSAVALFFLVSGYIMVVASQRLFGVKGGTQAFWLRRAVRILPPYWIATALLVAVFLWLGREVDAGHLLRSLALVPGYGADGARPLPILWPGWTLFYEMLFYLLFGLGISAGRWPAVFVAAGGIAALVLLGTVLASPGAVLFSATRPVSLLFPIGMALALWREGGGELPAPLRVALALAVVPAMALVPRSTGDALDFAYLLWAGLPALLLFAAVVGGPLRVPGPQVADVLGGMSYALYLLHLPVAWIWAAFYPGFLYALGPWFHFASLLGGAFVISLGFYLWIERPLTAALNRRVAVAGRRT